jgi:phosphatidylglycerophosphate synthase
MLALAVLLTGFESLPLTLSFSGYLLGSLLTILLMRRGYPHSFIGAGNITTLMRMALVSALLAPILGDASAGYVIFIATLALVLDGVDGWLARREGRVSDFGARLDIEVDSAFAMILAINSWVIGNSGPLIILFALPRYIFIAFAQVFPWLGKPLPSRIGGKVVGVIQIITLILLNVPNLDKNLARMGKSTQLDY